MLARHRQHHAPVKSQMQAPTDEAPVGAEDMCFLRRLIAAVLRQKREYIPRQEDTADHRAEHTKENHSDQRCLDYAQRCIFALSDCQQPFPVEYMVRKKQGEHSHSQPFMRRLAHKAVCHQKQQRDSHCGIDCEFDFLN